MRLEGEPGKSAEGKMGKKVEGRGRIKSRIYKVCSLGFSFSCCPPCYLLPNHLSYTEVSLLVQFPSFLRLEEVCTMWQEVIGYMSGV